jgi:hypothetical protein
MVVVIVIVVGRNGVVEEGNKLTTANLITFAFVLEYQ